MNYQRVLKFVSGSFEIFPSKCAKFENSLKLPGVLFSISLIIYTNVPLKPKNPCPIKTHSLYYIYNTRSIMSIYIHKLLKLPGLSCCARIKRAYVFCFKELCSFCKSTSHSARLRWTRTCEVLKRLLCHYSS